MTTETDELESLIAELVEEALADREKEIEAEAKAEREKEAAEQRKEAAEEAKRKQIGEAIERAINKQTKSADEAAEKMAAILNKIAAILDKPEKPKPPEKPEKKPSAYKFKIVRDDQGQIIEVLAKPI